MKEEFTTKLEDSKGTQGKPATIELIWQHLGFKVGVPNSMVIT